MKVMVEGEGGAVRCCGGVVEDGGEEEDGSV